MPFVTLNVRATKKDRNRWKAAAARANMLLADWLMLALENQIAADNARQGEQMEVKATNNASKQGKTS